MLQWRGTALPMRLTQVLIVVGFLALYDASALIWFWAAATLASETFAWFMARLELKDRTNKKLNVASTLAWSLSNLIFGCSALILLAAGSMIALTGAMFLCCAYSLNNAMMSRGSWYLTIATLGPSAAILILVPLAASNLGVPLSNMELVLLTIGSIAMVMLLGFLAAMLNDERKSLEIALAQLEIASEAKDRFLANMSHEIRTPLNGIVGIANVLHQSSLTPPQRELVGLIDSSSRVLERLLSDLLDTAKMVSGNFKLENTIFDLRTEIEINAKLMQAKARSKGLSFDLSFTPEADGHVSGDPIRLGQIVSNLVSNAVKFTEKGGVRIAVDCITLVKAEGPDDRLIIKVSDDGIGFDAETAATLFQAFIQADSSITRRFGGTGLGLSIAKALADAMGGTLTAESVLGRGSTFTLDIPFNREVMQREGEAPLLAPPEEPEDENTFPLRVLLAEDHPTNQKVVALLLEPMSVDLSIVENGKLAISAWQKGNFDIILMDMQMPVMDGLKAIEGIRAIECAENLKRTPIALLTANALAEHRMAGELAGADFHIAKPVTFSALKSGIEAAMQHAENVEVAVPFEAALDLA